jgi:DNA-binding MarR family transcriptional regulator
MIENSQEPARDLVLLEQIADNPDVSQASLATRLGVAVGTVNFLLKRLIAKGYVKVKRAERRKLRYIITPDGIAFRAHLTVDYINQTMLLYRNTRQRVGDLLGKVKSEGFDRVQIQGDGDIADVCRLTCLEQGVQVVEQENVPRLSVNGYKISLFLDDKKDGGKNDSS